MKLFVQKTTGVLVGLGMVALCITAIVWAFDAIDGKNWLTPERLFRSENLVLLAFALLGLLFVALLFDR